jgi:hypothetical protein
MASLTLRVTIGIGFPFNTDMQPAGILHRLSPEAIPAFYENQVSCPQSAAERDP